MVEQDEPEPDAATLAFAGLQAEIAELRQTVEGLTRAEAPDYSPTLAALAKSLQAIAARVQAIERHTGANLSPEIARREIMRVYDGALHPARLDLERATREVLDAGNWLARVAGTLRTRQAQRRQLVWAGLAGLVAGMTIAWLLVPAMALWMDADRPTVCSPVEGRR